MYLQLYESVEVTKGAKSSIIFDSQNGFLQVIPNALYDLISNRNENYNLLKSELDSDNVETLDEYLSFITEGKLGFMVETKEELHHFLEKNNKYIANPTIVEYCILDINSEKGWSNSLISQIKTLQIKFFQVRICNELDLKSVKKIISEIHLFNNSSIYEISIIVKYDSKLVEFLKDGSVSSDKFLQFIFHNCQKDDFENLGALEIIFLEKDIVIPIGCGVVNFKNLNLNKYFYNESLHHNSCLHKKIAIDIDGNIKNCPSMPQSFGNIKDTTLEEALAHKDFKKYWNVTKDQIEVCKDCEFRYICTDCRAYTERSHTNDDGLDISKPLKCGYDPYTGQWHEWSINPLKQKAINFYEMQDLAENK